MPIARFTYAEANKNLRSNRASRWPDGRGITTRLDELAKVHMNPSFDFSSSDQVFTIGSCFAREIEKYLDKLGFNLPALGINIPTEERVSATANDILNKYGVHSMENELRWGFEGRDIPDDVFYLSAGEGDLWHDAQLVPNLVPAPLARVIERRAMVMGLVKQLPHCRVVVITLGLAEAWFDTRAGIYLNGMPPQAAIQKEPSRFELHVLSFDEIVESLERIHAIISKYGHPDFRMLLTVSPVPFKATFSGKDALVANMYSKSVQRTAAEVFSQRHPNVDYFPSYEIVTLSNRKVAYELDNIHVTAPTVAHIMSSVVSAYVPGATTNDETANTVPEIAGSRRAVSTPSVLRVRAKAALEARDYESAMAIYASLLFRFGAKLNSQEEFETRLNLGIAMVRLSLPADGVEQLRIAKELMPGNARATYQLGLGLARAKLHDEALKMFREALELNPAERDYHWRLGMQLIRMGEVSGGLDCLREAIAIDPEHRESLEAIAKYGGETV